MEKHIRVSLQSLVYYVQGVPTLTLCIAKDILTEVFCQKHLDLRLNSFADGRE